MISFPTVLWRLGVVIVLVAALAFRPLRAAVGHPGTAHLWLVCAWVVLIALGQKLRGASERPIHDRQTDGIVATGLIGMSAILHWAVAPRLGIESPLWWVEIPLVMMFAMGWCVALFGTRPVFRHRRAWLFGMVFAWPLVHRLIVDLAAGGGGSELPALVGIAAIASAAAIGGPAHHSLMAAALTLIIAVAGAVLLGPVPPPHARVLVGVASAVACLPWFVVWLRARPAASRSRTLVVGRARTAESLGLCLAAVLMTGLGAMDAPPAVLQVDPVVEHALAAQPEGWERLAVVQIEDADRIFGQQAVWSRTYWRAEETNRAAHSRVGVPRRIVIDDVRVEDDRMLALLPFPAQYDLDGWERSAAVVLEGGELFNVVAMAAVLERIADVSLAATVVSVDVVLAEGGGQRVNVISVDDHRSTAPFLLPGRGVLTDVRSTVQRLLRGDTAGLTELERAKDLELLGGVIMSVLEPTRSERG